MRRKEKQVKEQSKIESMIKKALVCRLGLVDDPSPYIVPMSFGFQNNTFYFHSARKGKKIDLIQKNPNVCFEIDLIGRPIEAEQACDWGMAFQSIIGHGTAIFIKGTEKKKKALDIIMSQYSDKPFDFPEKMLAATAVFKIQIDRLTAKQSSNEFD